MRWVFQMFQAVHLVNVNGTEQVSNLTKEREDILQYGLLKDWEALKY
jgi:hypothetical protein